MNMLYEIKVVSVRKCGFPGIWVDSAKVAAIGIRVLHGVAYHGMALNLSVDQTWFAAINPCGTGLLTVNLDTLISRLPAQQSLARKWHRHFCLLV